MTTIKPTQTQFLRPIVKAATRGLSKARDMYVRAMMGLAQRADWCPPAAAARRRKRMGTTSGDFRELVLAAKEAEVRAGKLVGFRRPTKFVAWPAIQTIDEDREMEFNEQG